MSRLRGFQRAMQAEVFTSWHQGKRNVLAKAPTGAGKTVLMADTVRVANVSTAMLAHRTELVTQIANALALEGIPHRIIGPDSLRRDCCAIQLAEHGKHWVDANARVAVAGVDTLMRRDMSNDSWARGVGLWCGDEAHHFQKDNKWGDCAAMFPNAYGLGVTATPHRADGRGLSRDTDGVFDVLVDGPDMRTLIDAGYLTDYRVFTVQSDVVYDDVPLGSTGDYSQPKLRAAVHASDKFVGDVVSHYLKIARGKLGVTFAVDVESAQELAREYKAQGVPAEVVSAKTPNVLRAEILRRFRRRELLQLVNVDLFGEGFDLPAIEVVSFGRKTESLALYMQQFGRALRLMVAPEYLRNWDAYTPEERRALIAASEKPKAIIIDHVGNVVRHNVPDAPRVWHLGRRESRSASASDAIPLRVCLNPNLAGSGIPCGNPYERFRSSCPACRFAPVPADRSAPEFVDGNLYELAPEVLEALRAAVETVDGPPRMWPGMSGAQANGVQRNHQERIIAQHNLRNAMRLWSGWQTAQGYDPQEAMRRFFHLFGVDTLTAQALGRPEAVALTERITAALERHNIQAI